MIFNSIQFSVFFFCFFIFYWFLLNKNYKFQNLLMLTGSYVFYAWADWTLLFFLISISFITFLVGIYIDKLSNPKHKNIVFWSGIFQAVGALAYFKYYNFFVNSFNAFFLLFNITLDFQTNSIIVPLGISYLTFRIISYLLDINKGKIKPTTDWVVFFSYVAFFPSVLSGPIDRAKKLIPQLERPRFFDYNQATSGLRQILWGLFKKMVIADNCSVITNSVFDSFQILPGSTLLLGIFLFTIQVYADFSGYSDIALGVARLLGFEITKNFDFPYFSQNLTEFWRKWHISLTSWLTEYIFTPLSIAFRDWGNWGIIFAIVINLTICGFWHGANWNYVLYGFIHGCYFIPIILNGNFNRRVKKVSDKRFLPSVKETLNMIVTFSIVMFTFIIFRVESIADVFVYYKNMFSPSLFSIPEIPTGKLNALTCLILILLMFSIEWVGRNHDYAIEKIFSSHQKIVRWSFYVLIVFLIAMFVSTSISPFLYLKF